MTASKRPASRSAATRETEARPSMNRWAPPEQLKTPKAQGGYQYRWIAEYVRGEYQSRNLNMAAREGYRPVTQEELTDDYFCAPSEDGLVRTGGLILMKIPEEFTIQRKEYYANKSRDSLHSANALQGLDKPGSNMPVFEDDKSRRLEGTEALNALRGG